MHSTWLTALLCLIVLAAAGCTSKVKQQEVVVYTSRDRLFSEPVFKAFENETGIKVNAVYDTGATKTAGLANRLIAEKNNPQADVFWNSEAGKTIVLKQSGVLEPYCSPNAAEIPEKFKDPECYWAGFGARARAIIYNKNLVNETDAPKSIYDLTQPKWRGKVALGNAWLGTMATHHAALFLLLGDDKAKEFFHDLKDNDVKMLVGNTAVRDAVSSGEVPVGLIDTSDAFEAVFDGKPVAIVYPDQGENEMGAMLIPNTVALVKGGPNPENGRKFVDFMLSRSMERELVNSVSSQIPLKSGIEVPPHVKTVEELKIMDVDFEKVAAKMNETNQYLLELFT